MPPPPLKMKIQLYCGGEIAMGPGKADLLETICREGSLWAAGRALRISYRRHSPTKLNLSGRSIIDFLAPTQHKCSGMKYLLRHFLMIAVILGLAGQGVAFAATPCAVMQSEQTAKSAQMAGMSDCDINQHKSDKSSAPCQDMTAGCLAMAGCAALVAVDNLTSVIQAPRVVAGLEPWPTTSSLDGRDVPPELDPPSLLG